MSEVVAVVWDGPYHSVCIYVRWSVCGYNSVVLWFLNMVDLYKGKQNFLGTHTVQSIYGYISALFMAVLVLLYSMRKQII